MTVCGVLVLHHSEATLPGGRTQPFVLYRIVLALYLASSLDSVLILALAFG